jgi:PGF-CTERM protein
MTGRTRVSGALAIAVVVISAVVVGGAAGATGEVNHETSGDYEVFLPNEVDHYPGDQNRANASIQHLAGLEGTFDGTPSPRGYEVAEYLIIGNPDITFSSCSTENTAAFGVDRENDDPGTETDESLLAARKNSEFNDHEIIIEFFDEDDLAGDSIAINDVDEVVAVQNDCYTMPEEPGWYQINGFLNGTGYDGTQFDVTLDSHYFYICECSSEAEAREQLGPPPSEQGDDSTESTATATATPERTETATAAATAEPTATATATAESTATAERTATAAAEATATAESTATTTPGDGGGSDGGGADAGDEPSSPADESTATATAAPAGAADGPVTPTVGAGPGFGAVAALAGLLAVGLLAHRRD